MAQLRTIKVFVASPSDVADERNALAKLVGDINDVLAYLAPEKGLRLELVRYETHSYPDVGPPQEVINREIPVDYDIFIGIMWKRIGTQTSHDASGTVEEFHRACAHRKSNSLPRIMFYFCDERIAIPESEEDLEQLKQVVKFRKELESEGLTSNYPSHAEFAETVRGGLLRATRDILQELSLSEAAAVMAVGSGRSTFQIPSAVGAQPTAAAAPIDTAGRDALLDMAREYDRVRMTMRASDERTRTMSAIFTRMKIAAPKAQSFLETFERDGSAGVRLAAIAILNMFPDAEHLAWLAERLDPAIEKPFIAYHASVALLEAVTNLQVEHCGKLKKAISRALELGALLQGDPARLNVLRRAEQELTRKCKPAN